MAAIVEIADLAATEAFGRWLAGKLFPGAVVALITKSFDARGVVPVTRVPTRMPKSTTESAAVGAAIDSGEKILTVALPLAVAVVAASAGLAPKAVAVITAASAAFLKLVIM